MPPSVCMDRHPHLWIMENLTSKIVIRAVLVDLEGVWLSLPIPIWSCKSTSTRTKASLLQGIATLAGCIRAEIINLYRSL